jgi:hypothetical protein
MLVCVTSTDGSGELYVELVNSSDNGLVRYRHEHVWTDMNLIFAAVEKMEAYGVDLAHVEKSEHWAVVL